MRYSEIFSEIYKEHKRAIQIYVIIALAVSILAAGDGNIIYATAVTVGAAGTIKALGGDGGAIIATLFQTMGINIDVPSGLAIGATISILLDLIPQEALAELGISADVLGISFQLFDMWWMRIICYIWFLVTKLSNTVPALNTLSGVVEYVETKLGSVITLLVALSSCTAIFSTGSSVHAATMSEVVMSKSVVSPVLSALVMFFTLIGLPLVNMFVRTFFFFIRIILMPFSATIPMFSSIVDIAKCIMILLLGVNALENPAVFLVAYILITVISIIFFKKAYVTVRYFKNIYVKPFFKKFKGYDEEISLIMEKTPRKVRNHIAGEKVDVLIPVYLMKKIPDYKDAKRYDRWWFVSGEEKQWLYKPGFMNHSCHVIELKATEQKNIFIKESLRFFEIFTLKNEQNIGKSFIHNHKELHMVFSKEYFHRFGDIKEITGFVDYTEYCKEMKQEQKLSRLELREEKRLQRLALKEQRKLAKKKS